jgi:hypothetical protein
MPTVDVNGERCELLSEVSNCIFLLPGNRSMSWCGSAF